MRCLLEIVDLQVGQAPSLEARRMASTGFVLPPVMVEEFSYTGSALLYEGHARASPAELRSLLLPTGNANGISDKDRYVFIIL